MFVYLEEMMNTTKYIDNALKIKALEDVFGFKNMTNTLSVINRSTSIESSVHTITNDISL